MPSRNIPYPPPGSFTYIYIEFTTVDIYVYAYFIEKYKQGLNPHLLCVMHHSCFVLLSLMRDFSTAAVSYCISEDAYTYV